MESFSIFRVPPANEAPGGADGAISSFPLLETGGKVTDPCRWRFGKTACA